MPNGIKPPLGGHINPAGVYGGIYEDITRPQLSITVSQIKQAPPKRSHFHRTQTA